MSAGIVWVTREYPPQGPEGARGNPDAPFIVSPVPGTGREGYLRIVEAAGPAALPVSPKAMGLPMFCIRRVTIDGNGATLEVLRPVWADNSEHELVRLTLAGGEGRWQVTGHRLTRLRASDPGAEPYILPRAVEPGTGSPTPEIARPDLTNPGPRRGD